MALAILPPLTYFTDFVSLLEHDNSSPERNTQGELTGKIIVLFIDQEETTYNRHSETVQAALVILLFQKQ